MHRLKSKCLFNFSYNVRAVPSQIKYHSAPTTPNSYAKNIKYLIQNQTLSRPKWILPMIELLRKLTQIYPAQKYKALKF